MTFPLGSANLLLLHRELWGSRRASLTKTTSAGSQWLGGPQPLARPRHSIRRLLSQNTYRRRRLDLRTVPPSGFALCFSSPANPTQRRRRIPRSDRARQQRQTQRQESAKGGVPVSPSSPVAALHQRYEQPGTTRSQSAETSNPQNPEAGLFQRLKPLTPLSSSIFLWTRNSR